MGIITQVTVKKSPIGLLGTGKLLQPYSFTALSNNTLELDYKFNNAGTADAALFNVATGSLPAGTSVIGGDCPTGTATETLAAGASCITAVSVPNPNLFETPNLTNSTLNGAKLDISLPYSYSKDGGIVVESQPANRTYAQFSRLWGTVNSKQQSVTEEGGNYKIVVDTEVNVGSDTPGVTYPLTVKPMLTNGISGVDLPSCEIANSSIKTCTTTLSLPSTLFVPGSDVIINYEVSGDEMTPKDYIKNNVTVAIPGGNLMALQIDAQYAPAWSTNAPSDIRLQMVQFPGNGGIIQIKNTGKLTVVKGAFEPKGDGYYIWKDHCKEVDLAPQASCNLEVVAVRANSQTLRLQDIATGQSFQTITTTLPEYKGSKNAADWPTKVKVQKFPVVKITAKAGQAYQINLTPEGNDYQGLNLGDDFNNNTRTLWEWAIQKSGTQEFVVDYDVQSDSNFFAQISGLNGINQWTRTWDETAQDGVWQYWVPEQNTQAPSGKDWSTATAKAAVRGGFASARLESENTTSPVMLAVARTALWWVTRPWGGCDGKWTRRVRIPRAQGEGALTLGHFRGCYHLTGVHNVRYERMEENLLQGRGIAPAASGKYRGTFFLGTTQTKYSQTDHVSTWNHKVARGEVNYEDWLIQIGPKIESNTLYRGEIPIELTVEP